MHLYTYDIAPNPRRVLLALRYKGVELPTTQIDLRAGEQFSQSYTAINPDSTVPALQVSDDVVLTDTIAISLYIDKCHPEKPLFGSDDLEQAQIIGWCHKLFCEGFIPIAEVLRNESPAFADRALPGRVKLAQIPEMIERGQKRLEAFWLMVDEALQDKDYLVGSQLSQADIDLYTIAGFAGWIKQQVPESCEHLQQWQKRVALQLESE